MTSPFFTHYSVHKNDVFLRWFDETGKKRMDLIPYSPELYLETEIERSNTSITTIDNKPLLKVSCKNIHEFRNKLQEYSDITGMHAFGTRNAALQLVVEKFPDTIFETFNPLLIRRLNIDIETEVEVSVGFPSVDLAEEVITLITVIDSKRKKMFVFYFGHVNRESDKFKIGVPIQWVPAENEKEMLTKFLTFWTADFPDIVCGWNIKNFDVPYTINRMEKVLGKSETARLSPVGRISKSKGHDEKGRDIYSYMIQGVEVVDTLDLYRKIELDPRESYSLDSISSIELGATKLHHPAGIPGHKLYRRHNLNVIETDGDWGDWEDHRKMIEQWKIKPTADLEAQIYAMFYEAYVLYNMIDVKRAFDIEEKLSLFDILFFLTYYSHSNYADVISSMKFWSTLLYKFCLSKGTVFKATHGKGEKDGNFVGAYVRDPLIGRYNGIGCIVTYDVASMYPNFIRTLNISPEKLANFEVDVSLDDLVKGKFPDVKNMSNGISNVDYAMGANGATFRRDGIGLLPEKVGSLFDLRKREKKQAQEYENQINEIENELRRRGLNFEK